MDEVLINLVPFAPPTEVAQVSSAVSALGGRAIVIPGASWIDRATRQNDHHPLLLLLGQAECPCEAIQSALASDPRPALALFTVQHGALHSGIAESCHDFLSWPCSHQEFALRVRRIQALTREPFSMPTDFATFAALNLIGESPVFLAALSALKKISACDAPVLIEGETGTGKELAARAIHYLGARRDHPFIPVNCGAIPDNLFENELYGHERGAFTDAKDAQPGVVVQADTGTLFLDEIDSLSNKGQVALLRFLQDQRYKPLGGKSLRQADVRIIAASNADLDQLAQAGTFRRDLLYRLRILSLSLPPLRDRSGDARRLAEHFILRFSTRYDRAPKFMHHSFVRWLETYAWPGNVRELENIIHREFLMAEGETMVLANLSEGRSVTGAQRPSALLACSLRDAKAQAIGDFERSYLTMLIQQARGNVSLAARSAGTERRALGKLLKKHGIHAEQYRTTGHNLS